MGRPAKCRICGKRGNTDEMYKVVTGITTKTNYYYCSQEEWQAEQDRKKKFKEDKDKVYYLICDMFGYEIQNQKLFDEWAKWNKLKSNEIIYQYIRENEDYLQKVCDQSYNGEVQKIIYFSKILKNHLYDFTPKSVNDGVKTQPKVVTEEHCKTKYKPKARKALLDFEEDYDGE